MLKTINDYFRDKAQTTGTEAALRSLVGKVIRPPTSEEHLYNPKSLTIVSYKLDGQTVKIKTNDGLQKLVQNMFGQAGWEDVFKTSFSYNSDIDSIWMKFTIDDGSQKYTVSLTKAQIARVNGANDATTCCVCGKQLVPLAHMMSWCPDCEKD